MARISRAIIHRRVALVTSCATGGLSASASTAAIDPTTRLNHLANQTGKALYAFAVLALGLCDQLLARGVSDYTGTMQVLFVLGVTTVGIGLPVTMIAMGHQLRAAAKLPPE